MTENYLFDRIRSSYNVFIRTLYERNSNSMSHLYRIFKALLNCEKKKKKKKNHLKFYKEVTQYSHILRATL